MSSSSSHGLMFFSYQLLRDLANGWLVLAVVAQEYIKDFRFGVFCVHRESILSGEISVEDKPTSLTASIEPSLPFNCRKLEQECPRRPRADELGTGRSARPFNETQNLDFAPATKSALELAGSTPIVHQVSTYARNKRRLVRT